MSKSTENEIERLRSTVKQLSSKPSRNFLELSSALAGLKLIDPTEFASFLESVGLKSRTAYYFLELARIKEALRLTDTEVNAIGWTKFQVLGKHLTNENKFELINLARRATVSQLTAMLTDSRSTSRCMLLRFTAEEYELFSQAVMANGGRRRGKGLVGAETAILALAASALASA